MPVAVRKTAVADEKFVPWIVTVVPPDEGPAVGDTDVTVGVAMKVNWSAAEVALVPPTVITLMSTVPVPAGAVAVIEVALFTVKPVAAAPPNVTAVALEKPVPEIVTTVPPPDGPLVGETDMTVGVAT